MWAREQWRRPLEHRIAAVMRRDVEVLQRRAAGADGGRDAPEEHGELGAQPEARATTEGEAVQRRRRA